MAKRPTVKFKNKKITKCRLKYSRNTNNLNNRKDKYPRGTGDYTAWKESLNNK